MPRLIVRDNRQRERNEEVAASASAQGDGTPDAAEVATGDDAEVQDGGDDERVDDDRPLAAVRDAEQATERALQEQRDKYLRLAAEFDNYRKRVSREREETAVRAQGQLVSRIIDSLDDLNRVLAVDANTATVDTVVHGVHLVENKLRKSLMAAGLEVIDPIDQPFNPELHEAVSTEPALSPEDDHTVGRVYQVGYQFGGQLLRPARVVVKQWNE